MKNEIRESNYKVGQKWAYKTRSTEENSLFTILKIEELPKTGIVIHISVDSLRVKNSNFKGGYTYRIAHLPFSKEAIDGSVTKLVEQNSNSVFSMEGYEEWKKAFEKGQGGILAITIAAAIDTIEKTLN